MEKRDKKEILRNMLDQALIDIGLSGAILIALLGGAELYSMIEEEIAEVFEDPSYDENEDNNQINLDSGFSRKLTK